MATTPALQRAEAHRIKGVAGNLGLPHLSDAAAKVEALHTDAPHAEQVEAWSALNQALLSTVNHVAALRAQATSERATQPGEAATHEVLDEAGLQALQTDARTLQQAFSRGECLDDLLAALCERAHAAPNPALLQAARQAADDFDFETAARELGAWLDALTPQEA